jgi:hypothetical protein
VRSEHGAHLREVLPPVDAGQHQGIDLATQRLDRRNEPHAPAARDLAGEPLDARGARLDVRAAALEGRYDAAAGHVTGGGRIVQQARELDRVRGVEADQANAQRRGRRRLAASGECTGGDHHDHESHNPAALFPHARPPHRARPYGRTDGALHHGRTETPRMRAIVSP